MSAQESTYSVRIADLLVHDHFQVRNKRTDPATVDRYKKVLQNNLAFRDPITVGFIKPHKGSPKGIKKKRIATGTLVLLDGFHRVEAAEAAGVEELPAVVIETTEEHAAWIAAEANTSNGLPLKSKEYRNVLAAYVEARQYFGDKGAPKSYRTIAQELGGVTSYSTIRRWMFADHPGVFRLLQDNGEDIEPPGGLPDAGRRATMAEEVTADTVEAIKDALKVLPNLNRDQRAELQMHGLGLAIDCRQMGTSLPDGAPGTAPGTAPSTAPSTAPVETPATP